MKIITVAIALIAIHAVGAEAQSSSDLSSTDPTKREETARALAAQAPLTAAAKTALVDLLAKEKGLIKPAFPEQKPSADEGFGEYISWLTDEVMKIADAEPNRTDVWNALLAADMPAGYSAQGVWLGTHGDKALPYLLAHARDHRNDPSEREDRKQAVELLAQVVAYERRPEAVHHLSAADLQTAESVIRDGLGDPDVSIRSYSVVALQIIGDPKDLPVLEQIALTDDYVSHEGGPTGTEIVFPIRLLARGIVDRMRAKLAANPNARAAPDWRSFVIRGPG